MSGTGKSSALDKLGRRGFRVVETDIDGWSEWIPPSADGEGEWRWREDRIAALLAEDDPRTLYVSGCVANQVRFYDRFDAIVLLSAPAEVLLERLATRTTNDYGKSPDERDLILSQLEWVEPLLRKSCTHELDASRPLADVVDDLVAIGRGDAAPDWGPAVAETWSMPAGSRDRWPDDYERGRPGWPAEVVAAPGLAPDATVLELGAGTGKLTRLLLPAFARVVAVEPADPMRRLLVERCPEADALAGTAQGILLADGSVDAVFAAESFHWFHDERALAEIRRVLRPSGALVLMWNLPAGPWEPSTADAERLLLERGPAPGEIRYEPLDLGGHRGEWRAAFAGAAFEPLRDAVLPNPQTLDRDGLVSFYASMGWFADLPDGERLPLVEDVRSLLPAAEYRRLWETHLHWTRRL